jgi:predicted permease
MFKLYFKTILRNLWRNSTYSLLNIFGLAIGIACAGIIFLWVEDEMTFDNVHVKKERLYRVNINGTFNGNVFTMGSTPRPLAAALKKEIPGIVNTARISDEDQRSLFRINDKSLYASGRYADSSIFSMLTFDFVQGSAKTVFLQLYSLVITESAAKKFFGEETNVVGKTVRVDNKQDYVVSAVVKDPPPNSSLQFDWLASYEINLLGRSDDGISWGSYGPFTYVELDAHANVSGANKYLKDFIHRKETSQMTEAFLFPMSDWRLYDEFENGKQTGNGRVAQVRMLSAIAWIILFIACINFMNLATANSHKRAKEIGVRKVLGSGKKSLVIQFISEALFMSLIASVTAIGIIAISLPAFNSLMQKRLLLDIFSARHLLGLLILTIICGLAAGSYPAMYLSAFKPVLVLKGLKLKTGGAAIIRKGLVVLQFTVSVVFISSTIIVYMQIQHIKDRNLGLNKDNLVEINMQHDISNIFPLIKQDLLRTGAIENAAISDHVTIYGGNTDSRFRWHGKPDDSEISIAFRSVSPEFISTSGMQVIEGRDFNANSSSENRNVIINQSLAKLMETESAVGKIIQSPRENEEGIFTNLTVVGVINDYVYGNMYGKSGPVIFFCQPPQNATLLYVRTKPQNSADGVLAKIEAVMKKHNPSYPLEYKFVDDQFNELLSNEILVSKISGVFAVLAIIISCLGLFGLAAYTAERRTKEIGVRKVLGATVAGVVGLLSKDFVRLVLLSSVVAFPLAWWIMDNWLNDYEYRITISWWIFGIAALLAIIVALFTISFQAIKAAMVNPVKSLRAE